MRWLIDSFPASAFHTFLSHSAEDRDSLVHPVHQGLIRAGVVPWLDRHHYPFGRPARISLRDSLLRCRHVVFFITDAMLTQPRGWCVHELILSELIQDNLVEPGAQWVNVILPLYFVTQEDSRLPRSVWETVRQRGSFCPPSSNPVSWSVREIVRFLSNERTVARDFGRLGRRSHQFRSHLEQTLGRYARVTRFTPPWRV